MKLAITIIYCILISAMLVLLVLTIRLGRRTLKSIKQNSAEIAAACAEIDAASEALIGTLRIQIETDLAALTTMRQQQGLWDE